MQSKLAIPLILLIVTVTILFPAGSYVSAATTYSITINTVLDSTVNGISVPITIDGLQTGYYTPHTFSGLSGTHSFTVPYSDSKNHPFSDWSSNTPTDSAFNTISVSSGNTYWAYYDSVLPRGNGDSNGVSPAEQRYYITPSDPSVIALAANKSWSDIINWVSSNIAYNYSCNIWQFPNDTITQHTGQCREFSTLAVSMLLARGYTAYVVTGNQTDTSGTSGHAWIALNLNGIVYHFEPQRSWAKQPSSQEFLGYNPEYFLNNTDLLASIASSDPPPAQTYDITINSELDTTFNGNHVAILQDGQPTGFTTPHTFVGLVGIHNFTIPYTDDNNHSFQIWSTNTPGDHIFPTITVSTGGSFTAFYTSQFSLSQMYAAEYRYLITPYDSAVIEAAGSKSLNNIFDYISSLPMGTGTLLQFPNQTIAKGTVHFYVDRASLCCSMLCARGYTAYMSKGNSPTTDAWIVVNINGVAYHLDPNYPWSSQQSINFGAYTATYYVDQNGIYPPSTSVNPPANLPTITPTPTPTPTPSPTQTPTPSPTQTPTPTPTPTMTPTITPTPTPTPTSTPMSTPTMAPTVTPMPIVSQTTNPTNNPTAQPTTNPTASPAVTPKPSPSIPEFPWLLIVPLLLSVFALTIVLRYRKTANFAR
jgi:transglutaminase-like putative cysteine protease